jgi:hypothetical protein
MINPLLIELHPAAPRAWLIFESMDRSVLGTSNRFRVDPISDPSLALAIPFLSLYSPPTALHLSQTLARSIRLATDQRYSLQSP